MEAEQGRPLKGLDSRPELTADLLGVWEAFSVLSSGRGVGVGLVAVPLPLGFDVIDAYARRFGPPGQADFERFYRLLRAMDAEFMAHALKKGSGK